jgi:SAM-dependent methyltransferase
MGEATSNIPQIFQPEYYQRLYEIEEKHWWALGMRDLMAAWLDEALRGRVGLTALDVGCGTGLGLDWLRRYALASEAAGVDLSAYALSYALQRGASVLALAAADRLPFRSGSFNVILCLDVLQHVAPAGADRRAIAEFARLLRPGGCLFLRTNSALGHVPLRGANPDRYRRYRLDEVTGMLAEAGLRVERASYANALLSVWAMLREYLAGGSQSTAPVGPGLTIRLPQPPALNRLLYGVLRLENRLISRRGRSLPFGHSIVALAWRP